MRLNDLADKAHAHAVSKGFYEKPPEVPTLLCLLHSEVSEALEAWREGHAEGYTAPDGKPEGLPAELADVVIRVADMAGFLGIDLEAAVAEKMAFNATRPHRHGGKRA